MGLKLVDPTFGQLLQERRGGGLDLGDGRVTAEFLIPVEFLAVCGYQLVLAAIGGQLNGPGCEIPVLGQFAKRRLELAADEREMLVANDVENLAELRVALLEAAFGARSVEPHLKQRHQNLRDL